MSLNIHCPKCNAVYGRTGLASGLKKEYYNIDKYGHPICDVCGYNKQSNVTYKHVIFVIILIAAMFALASWIAITIVKN